MESKIVSDNSVESLSYVINLHVQEGWRPSGNIFSSKKDEVYWNQWEETTYYHQLMVKGD